MFDGLRHEHVGILPIVQSHRGGFGGQEYLGHYPAWQLIDYANRPSFSPAHQAERGRDTKTGRSPSRRHPRPAVPEGDFLLSVFDEGLTPSALAAPLDRIT